METSVDVELRRGVRSSALCLSSAWPRFAFFPRPTPQDAAKKGPGKKEEGASWEVLDNLRMVSDGTRLVTHKRQFIVFNETLNHTVLRHWLEYVDGNETLIYHFPRSLFELLPLEEPQWHFKTCAVVSARGCGGPGLGACFLFSDEMLVLFFPHRQGPCLNRAGSSLVSMKQRPQTRPPRRRSFAVVPNCS